MHNQELKFLWLCFVIHVFLINCVTRFVQARKLQERGWQPRWFQKDDDGCYGYVGGYWEAREKENWGDIPNIFGDSDDSPPHMLE